MRSTRRCLAILAGVLAAVAPASAATDQELYRSVDLRIYRSTARDGSVAVVLTNLDEEGRRLGGDLEEATCPSPSSTPAPAPPAAVAAPAAEAPAAGPHDGASSGTTIVININTPPAPPEPEAPAQAAYPVVFAAGSYAALPGPIHYPSHQPFLGYGLDVSSPGWFGGLGLNAGNRFGLKTGSECGRGYDCMLGPR